MFESVLDVSRRIVGAVTRLTWVTAGYGWFTIIAPILVAAPGYFAGTMTFGELMMVVGAFNQVQQSLRWFVDNFSNIADWRATLLQGGELPRDDAHDGWREPNGKPHRLPTGRTPDDCLRQSSHRGGGGRRDARARRMSS